MKLYKKVFIFGLSQSFVFIIFFVITIFLIAYIAHQRRIISTMSESNGGLANIENSIWNYEKPYESKKTNIESDPFQLNLYPVFDLPLEYFDTESVSIGAGSYSTLYEIPAYQSYPSTEITIPERYYSVEIQDLPVIKSDEEIYGFNPEEDFFGTSIEDSINKYGDLARRFVGEPGGGLFVSSVEWADVTGDGDKEQIVSLIQMGANILGESNVIIKNNQIIFSTELDSFSQLMPAQNGNGFFLQWSDNYKYRDGFMMTRFVYDGEKFVSVYEQQTRYVRINDNKD